MANLRSYLVVALLASIPLVAAASNPVRIEIAELAKNGANLLGRSIVAHGCLVNTPHGSFIEPCGSNNWNELVPVSDPEHKGVAARDQLGINLARDVEADFAGVLIERDVSWPKPGKRIFLRLKSITNSSPYEP